MDDDAEKEAKPVSGAAAQVKSKKLEASLGKVIGGKLKLKGIEK
jgi:hypothetical protein